MTLCDSLLKQAGHKIQVVTKGPSSSPVPRDAPSYCRLDSQASDWTIIKCVAIV